MSDLAIEIEGLAFAWSEGRPVLDIPRFEVRRGKRLFLRGPSGSGKSTLLGIVSGVLAATTRLLASRFGLFMETGGPGVYDLLLAGAVVGAADLAGLVPAWLAYRNSLADGLTIRT